MAGRQKGPASSLDTGHQITHATEGAATKDTKGLSYDVATYTGDEGLKVVTVRAESGDEAAQKVLAMEDYRRASIRGVTPTSDPDPNSLGGERDAGIMFDNADKPTWVHPLGTEANAEATEKLARGDVTELKD